MGWRAGDTIWEGKVAAGMVACRAMRSSKRVSVRCFSGVLSGMLESCVIETSPLLCAGKRIEVGLSCRLLSLLWKLTDTRNCAAYRVGMVTAVSLVAYASLPCSLRTIPRMLGPRTRLPTRRWGRGMSRLHLGRLAGLE